MTRKTIELYYKRRDLKKIKDYRYVENLYNIKKSSSDYHRVRTKITHLDEHIRKKKSLLTL